MNKYDRRKLNTSARKNCSTVAKANRDFPDTIGSLTQQEADKLEHLPESLSNSSQAVNIEEAIDLLSTLQESLEAIEGSSYDIMESADIDLPQTATSYRTVEEFDSGPGKNRFQILLPDQLLLLMKMRAMQSGINCNELICQAIQNELLKDPNK